MRRRKHTPTTAERIDVTLSENHIPSFTIDIDNNRIKIPVQRVGSDQVVFDTKDNQWVDVSALNFNAAQTNRFNNAVDTITDLLFRGQANRGIIPAGSVTNA